MPSEQSKKQVLSYKIEKNKWAIAAMSLFVADVACVLLIGVIDSIAVLALMAVLSAACLFCTLHIKETSKTEQLSVADNPSSLDVHALTAAMPDHVRALGNDGKETENTTECFLASKELNRLFVTRPLWAKVPDEPYRLPEQVLPFISHLKDYRNASLADVLALRPDKEVAGLAGDISEELFDSERPEVEIDIVTRYSVQVTDDAFNKLVVNKKKISDKVVFDGRSLALDAEGHLKGFSASGVCNEIDIQSLIVSSDGYLMVARATDEHPLYPGKKVASAACSLLPSEIESRPLQESMVESLHSKIDELYDIPGKKVLKSSFVGMTRMMPRGGAPEFYCLTFASMSKEEIVASHRDPSTELVPEKIGTEEEHESGFCAQDIAETMENVLAGGDVNSLSLMALAIVAKEALLDDDMLRKISGRLGIGNGK